MVDIFYRFGIPEKELLKNNETLYNGLIISAHVAEYYNKSISIFLENSKKPFFIDPVTYVFARNPKFIKKNGKLKKSYMKLAAKYGNLIQEIAGKGQLQPHIFKDISVKEEICKQVLKFQKEYIGEVSKPLSKYFKILDREEIKPNGPLFLVPPYFYVESIEDNWYEINLELAKSSLKFKDSYKIYPVIFISQDMLEDKESIDIIIEDYKNFEGCLVWVSGFNEMKASIEVLNGFLSLISGLSQDGKKVYSLYGGYFSALVSKFGLTGFSNGICYGESKNVDMSGGGAPPIRFYVHQIKSKAMEADSRDFFTEFEDEDIQCKCDVCKKIKITSGDKPYDFFDSIRENPKLAKEHFMACRKIELDEIETTNINNLIDKLDNTYNYFQFELNSYLYRNLDASHLKKWVSTIRKDRRLLK